jgi:hypothetical protein
MASLVAVLTDDPEPAPNAGPLRPVIEGLLRKDPAERLTVDEVAAMLDRVLMDGADGPAEVPLADSPEGVTRRLPSSVVTAVDEPDVLSEAVEAAVADDPQGVTQVTAPDDTGETAAGGGYPVRSIVIVAGVLLVLFAVFVFATFS